MGNAFTHYAQKSSDGLATVQGDGRFSFVNEAFSKLFLQGNLVGDATLHAMHVTQGGRDVLEKGVHDVRASGKEARFSWEENVQGRARCFECRVIPHTDQAVLLECKDITEIVQLKQDLEAGERTRKHAEKLIARRNRLFYGLLDEFPAFVYMQRQNYTVAYANKHVRNLYGETESRLCYEVFAGRKTPCPVCPTFEVFDTGMPVEWEFMDDKGRTFRIYDYPFEDETGEKLVMELGIDVTDLKRVETELFQAQKLRAIGVLAGGIAHDLNNNLVPIIFNIDYALHKIHDNEVKTSLEEAQMAAYRAGKLVEQVLEYSRQQDISRSVLRLMPLIKESVATFQAAKPDTVRVCLKFDADNDHVMASDAQMRQVVLNLLRNAAQAMPEGGEVRVALTMEEADGEGNGAHPALGPGSYCALRVSDAGQGIDEEHLERVFEPFFTTKKGNGGTGMGLAVVHSIITGSGGAISVENNASGGATFTVYLPEAPKVKDDFDAGVTRKLQKDGQGRVLLVDDDPGALSAMARSLRGSGFSVVTATSGEQGVEEYARSPEEYSLVLADQSMTGMSGIEMSAKILAVNNDASIVICTGHVEPALEKQALRQGIAGFVMKPMAPNKLVQTVQYYCR